MAKKRLASGYTFTAAAKTITHADFSDITLEGIQLIVNVTDQIIIYNFADTTKGGTLSTDTLTLEYNTTTMSDTDKLMILVEDGTTTQPVSFTGSTDVATQTTLAALNAKLVTGTVIGNVNLGATDNAVLDQIELNTDPLLVVGGGVEATAIRVTIANNSTGLVSVNDNSGSLTIDAPVATPVFVTPTPSATGGWTSMLATSSDGATALTATAQVIKASAGTFGGYYIFNPNAAAIYVHIYNVAAASVTVGTTNPQLTFCIPATQAANLEIGNGVKFATAMSIACTTTGGGNTAPTTALEAVLLFK